MKRIGFIGAAILLAMSCAAGAQTLRAPAVPLVTHDPYFSVWSAADKLTDRWPTHWTGTVMGMCGMARIDGKSYRYCGPEPADIPALEQTGVEVHPTRTVYHFQAGGVALDVTFLSPLITEDLDVLSRPVSYVTFEARSLDSAGHAVSVYLDCSGEWAVNTADQQVTWSRVEVEGLDVMRIGTVDQPVLGKAGDNLRIDWGYFHLAAPKGPGVVTAIAADKPARSGFVESGRIPAADDTEMPRRADDRWPVLALAIDLGQVSGNTVSSHALFAYDDLYSIELFGQKLRPYWRRHVADLPELLALAERECAALVERCRGFDDNLERELRDSGGEQYAAICAQAWRVALAAQKLAAAPNGDLLMFPKENFSNGCISTVDVFYPASPLYLYADPMLMRAQMQPILDYASSPRWKFPFAPHDLGTYPLANGQVYGGGEKTEENQMPVEESANMLLLLAAVARVEDTPAFALRYWPVVEKWAQYLLEKGLDPENQLCTDDFAGHLAHNANLSAKAIVALGGYAMLCDMLGKADEAAQYRARCADMGAQWIKMADDGDHYRLAFDKPGTWSQKYNLVWDKFLGLDIFPPEVYAKEMAFYLKMQKKYGLPLDNRKDYTKLDWLFWTATLAENNNDFEALIAPAYKFVNETPDRYPLTDWYDTVTAKQVGFVGRPVIGGLFIRLMETRVAD